MDEPTAISANPERAIETYCECRNVMIAQCGSIFCIEAGEADAIESGQAETSADPQIAIGCLSDCANEIMRQAFVGLPGARSILGERSFGRFGCRCSWGVLSRAGEGDGKPDGWGHQNARYAAKLSHELGRV